MNVPSCGSERYEELVAAIQAELRSIAVSVLRGFPGLAEKKRPTSLVNTIWAKPGPWHDFADRAFVRRAAMHAMRNVLVDLLRRRDTFHGALEDESEDAFEAADPFGALEDAVEVAEAIGELADKDPEAAAFATEMELMGRTALDVAREENVSRGRVLAARQRLRDTIRRRRSTGEAPA